VVVSRLLIEENRLPMLRCGNSGVWRWADDRRCILPRCRTQHCLQRCGSLQAEGAAIRRREFISLLGGAALPRLLAASSDAARSVLVRPCDRVSEHADRI